MHFLDFILIRAYWSGHPRCKRFEINLRKRFRFAKCAEESTEEEVRELCCHIRNGGQISLVKHRKLLDSDSDYVVQLKENYNTHHVRLHQLKTLSISTCTLTRLPNFITVTFSPNFYTQKKTTQTKYTDDESHFLMEWEQEVHGPSRPA